MRLTPIVLLGLAFLIPVPGFAQEWTEFASVEDRFTCNFPGEPDIIETTYQSEYGAVLPARIYSAVQGQSRYSVKVVDYNPAEQILTEKAEACPPGAETCRGGTATGAGYWRNDVRGAIVYASWQFMQRDADMTQYTWNVTDLVEGHTLHLTNRADQSRTFASIHMHENKLYIVEGTVPAGYPEPGIFQQSLGWLDENGIGLRYEAVYSNGYLPPPRVDRAVRPGQGRIDAPGTGRPER
jgi:hypothetical protein